MNYRNARINSVAALVLSLSAAAFFSLSAAAFFALGRVLFGVGGLMMLYSVPIGALAALLLLGLWFVPVRSVKEGPETGSSKTFGWRESWAFIAVTVFLFLAGFFIVDGGDTEDSVNSVFTLLVGRGALDLSWILFLLCFLGAIVSYIVGLVVAVKGRIKDAEDRVSHPGPTETQA
ncbi:hypothetical protein HMPREF3104_11780 [Corynebacterium sp. HMSC30G07]|uniref:hypothetical protein n=1 Tax=Corynebacterium sp. HMSC30G07 TaxID=1581072 RepID=UPI0008CBA88D|nr:hypothetical protein [Corynebacterium sp. HMSC30G07]OFT73702.1 hypothetical protein HMPREF3104_11780 [Corynebacterium sp. HMSC30G07]